MCKRYWAFAISFYCAFIATSSTQAREIALTFDDAPTPDSALMTGAERTRHIIAALKAAKVPDVLLFVKGDYITPQTADRLNMLMPAFIWPIIASPTNPPVN